ncbi:MAG: hypothetical protein QOE45_2255 [Frankiaceae bacterium]|nr:hypothetical protein [Frankiaceae bacterium]
MRRFTVLLAACLLAAGACSKSASPDAAPTSPAPSATPTPSASASLGAVFYEDRFADKTKGWPEQETGAAAYVLHDDYAIKQYTVTAKSPGTSVAPHPAFRGITREQLTSYAVDATLQTTLHLSSADWFGVTCRDLGGKRYSFELGYDTARTGTMPWLIAKHDASGVHVLAQGSTASGGSAFRVGATCTGGTGGPAHLTMTLNDTQVGGADDADAPLPQGYAGVYLYTKVGTSTINVLDFAVRAAG